MASLRGAIENAAANLRPKFEALGEAAIGKTSAALAETGAESYATFSRATGSTS